MAPLLYNVDISPPCRAVQMLAKAIGLTLDVKDVNLVEGEHLQPAYLKINPQHTVPTLDDDGYILWDSHAINAYLVNKYAKNDKLYPKDIKIRGTIDQRLHFDGSVVFALMLRIGKSLRLKETKTVPENLKAELDEVYAFLEAFLQGNDWVCGKSLTIADISLVATISSLQVLEPLTDKYSNVKRWLNNCTKELWYEANLKGLNDFNTVFGNLMKA